MTPMGWLAVKLQRLQTSNEYPQYMFSWRNKKKKSIIVEKKVLTRAMTWKYTKKSSYFIFWAVFIFIFVLRITYLTLERPDHDWWALPISILKS